VFLECAFFNPTGIRKTSKRLDLSSDSSYRFERGVGPGAGLEGAIDTAAELIRELAQGQVARGVVDAYPAPLEPRRVALRVAQVKRLLGVALPKDDIARMLSSLGFVIVSDSGDSLVVETPLFRHDVRLEADLIEEIGRLYGYDAIAANETASVSMTRPGDRVRTTLDTIRKALAYGGLHEAVTNSMTSEKRRALLTPDIAPVVLLNPISPDMAQMRTTFLGSLLEAVSYNLNRKNFNNRFFEIGKTFASRGLSDLPDERDVVAILVEGAFEPDWWQREGRQADFYTLKALLNSLAAHCGERRMRYEALQSGSGWFTPEAARVVWDSGVSGSCGRVRPDLCAAFDIDSPIFYAELDFTALLASPLPRLSYTPLPRYPALERDFAFVMPESLMTDVICRQMEAVSELVEAVEPFDVYRGEKLGRGLKSIALAVRLRAPDRTLTEEEAREVCGRIVSVMKEKHGATLRS